MKRNGTWELATLELEKETPEPGGDKRLGMNQTFVGHGVMIVAKETVNDKVPLCLGLGPSANQVIFGAYATLGSIPQSGV